VDLKPEEIDSSVVTLYKQRMEDLGKDDPSTFRCLPSGPRQLYAPSSWVRIVQTPAMIVMLEDLIYRQIFMDGRELPKDPNPSFMGYSVGRWDGDTLVVDSAGFNDRTWLDFGGHPHSESLRVTERFHRRDFGHTDLAVTLEDPKAYKRPWTLPVGGVASSSPTPKCSESSATRTRRTSASGRKVSDETNCGESRTSKRQAAGSYTFRIQDLNSEMHFNVTLAGSALLWTSAVRTSRSWSRCPTRPSRGRRRQV
jgi:hypothetical protein